jgi:hypothetical protein
VIYHVAQAFVVVLVALIAIEVAASVATVSIGPDRPRPGPSMNGDGLGDALKTGDLHGRSTRGPRSCR